MKNKLAYIDDHENNLECIGLVLAEDYSVETFLDPLSFLIQYPEKSYTAILVDIHMPRMDGFTLYEKILEHPYYNGCPIIFISSDDTDENRIKSFSLGAVDFLNRQISNSEMLTRIKSKIIFFQKHQNILKCGNLKLDLTLLKTYVDDEEIRLTFIEFKLLYQFLKMQPGTVPKDDLMVKVWEKDVALDATLYTHVFNLNAKVSNWIYEINIERNKGVMLTDRKGDA